MREVKKMLKYVLNDTVVKKTVTGCDEYNNPVISEIKTIKCRLEFSDALELSSASSESCAPVKMFCTEKVSAGDLIVKNYRDYKVTQVDERKNLDGDVEFYEVYMI